MPGFLIPFQLNFAFEFAAIRFPALLDPLTRLMATIFITYSMVSIGVIAAFVWDSLSFDRRDAMVLGPLPLSGPMVIAAKLAAMMLFLFAAAVAINALTAVPFGGFRVGDPDDLRWLSAAVAACAHTRGISRHARRGAGPASDRAGFSSDATGSRKPRRISC